MNKVFFLAMAAGFLVLFILLSGCMAPPEIDGLDNGLPAVPGQGVPPLVPTPKPVEQPLETLEEGLGLVSEIPDEFRFEIDHVYSGNNLPAYSYLGGFAMLAKNKNFSVKFQDVVAASGVGSQAVHLKQENLLVDGYSVGAIGHAAANLGFVPFLAASQGGTFTNERGEALTETAKQAVELESAQESFTLLKRLVASGVPAMVNLDVFYLRESLAEHSTQWREAFEGLGGQHKNHFFVVSGFDQQKIYLNDSTEKDSAKATDMAVPINSFKSAWLNGNHSLIEEEFRLGPHWMLFLGPGWKTGKTYVEIARWNAEQSSRAALAIKGFAARPNVVERHNCVEMHVARVSFSNWLRAHGFHAAADKYSASGIFFKRLCLSTANQNKNLESIADMEEAGLKYLEVV